MDILHMADLVNLRQPGARHRSGILEHKVTLVHIDLDQFAAAVLGPLDVFFVEEEQVHKFHYRG